MMITEIVTLIVGVTIVWQLRKWQKRKDLKKRMERVAKERNVEIKRTIFDLPFIGSGLGFMRLVQKNVHRYLDFQLDFYRKHGKMYLGNLPLRPPFLCINDPDMIEYILKGNFYNYVKGDVFYEMFAEFLGTGIFNTDGQQWKKQRSTASHLFTVRELRSMVEVFSKHGETVLRHIDKDLSKEVDIQDLFFRYTLDSFGEIAFGVNIGSLDMPEVPFAVAFDTVNLSTFMRFANPFWKYLKRWNKHEKVMREQLLYMDKFVYDLIEERKKDAHVNDRDDLISYYIKMMKNGEQPDANEKELRDFVANFMLAGRDTTATLLTWTFYMLSRNPHVLEKLVSEIDTSLQGSKPDFENIKNLKYLKAVLDETLRLWPPVPANSRCALEDDILPDGTFVPKGTRLGYHLWVVGRNPEYWDNPEEFIPERFFEKLKKPNAFMPFHWGNRLCLGQNMAYNEARVMVCMILQNYQFKLAPGQNVTYTPSVTLRAKDGVKLIFSKRN